MQVEESTNAKEEDQEADQGIPPNDAQNNVEEEVNKDDQGSGQETNHQIKGKIMLKKRFKVK